PACRPRNLLQCSFGARVGAIVVMLSAATQAFAEDASIAWRRILQKCAASDTLGKQAFFFGVSNSIGPGSVWRFADDKSIRLRFELSDAFPAEAQRAILVKSNPIARCAGDSTSNWDLKLSLPFATRAIPLAGNIAATLGHAKKITVSVSGFAID